MGSCDVKIEIDRSKSGGTFTNYDIISGKVTLTVTNAITLNYIQVKLEGVSKTELSIPREPKGRKERRDKVLEDVHKLLYDTMIVFPPENIRQVSNAKEFTLTPGNYTYPFQFKLPLNNACTKILGITNKVLFNPKKLDFKINNGNFNTNTVITKANQYYQTFNENFTDNQLPHLTDTQSQQLQLQQLQQPLLPHVYHTNNQLPPSLSGLGDFASIKYYVKVTCKRSSFLKTNLRGFDPFIFLPLDLDSHNNVLGQSGDYEEYKEIFVRKEIIFKNRIPDIVGLKMPGNDKKPLPSTPHNIPPKRQGLLLRFFDPKPSYASSPSTPLKPASNSSNHPKVTQSEVPFSFEARFRHPAFLIPTKPPSFKLYLVSHIKPSVYSLAQYGKPEESNGLGVIYMQKLVAELSCTTTISVLENDGYNNEIHRSRHEDLINLCNNTYQNLKFDLMDCKKLKSSSSTTSSKNVGNVYELEIPKKYFSNCVLPDYLSPSFRTCNIQRKYKLTVVGGFSCEPISDFNNQKELNKKLTYVDLQVNDIKVLAGLGMTSSLHTNANGDNISTTSASHNGGEKSGISNYHNPSTGSSIHDPMMIPPSLPSRPSRPSMSSHSPHSLVHNDSFTSTNSESLPLPTYEDVMVESSYQDDSEHVRARRRYQQHEQYYNNLD